MTIAASIGIFGRLAPLDIRSPHNLAHADGYVVFSIRSGLAIELLIHSDDGRRFGPYDGWSLTDYTYNRIEDPIPLVKYSTDHTVFGEGWTLRLWIPTPLIWLIGAIIFFPYRVRRIRDDQGFPVVQSSNNPS